MAKVSKTELIRLYKTLKSDEVIGKKFGVTRQAIHQLRKKYGIESKYVLNPARNSKILELFICGMTGTAVAKKIGMSVSQAYRIINSEGMKIAKKVTMKKK